MKSGIGFKQEGENTKEEVKGGWKIGEVRQRMFEMERKRERLIVAKKQVELTSRRGGGG